MLERAGKRFHKTAGLLLVIVGIPILSSGSQTEISDTTGRTKIAIDVRTYMIHDS